MRVHFLISAAAMASRGDVGSLPACDLANPSSVALERPAAPTRAALLGGAWLGALAMLAPDAARATRAVPVRA